MNTQNSARRKRVTILGPKESLAKLVFKQSIGLLRPTSLQRSLNSFLLESLELSRNKSVRLYRHGNIKDLDIDNVDDRFLLTGDAVGIIYVHDLERLVNDMSADGIMVNTRQYKMVGSITQRHENAHIDSIKTIQWHPNNCSVFTSSSKDNMLKVWDANNLQMKQEYQFRVHIHCHQMSKTATHQLIALATHSSNVKMVDLRIGKPSQTLRAGHRKEIKTLQWSPVDEYTLATGGKDKMVVLWDIRSPKSPLMRLIDKNADNYLTRRKPVTHEATIKSLCFTSDGLHLATLGKDYRLHLWDIRTGNNLGLQYPDFKDGRQTKTIKMCMPKNASTNMAFVPNGLRITAFNIFSPRNVSYLHGHLNSVKCCIYHERGSQLISGGKDRFILLWTRRGDRNYEEFFNDYYMEQFQRLQ